MSDIVGKTINKQYAITELIYEDEFVINYNGKDIHDEEYLIIRLKNSTEVSNDILNKFYGIANFFKKFSIDNLPTYTNIIRSASENIIILKNQKGNSFSGFFLENNNAKLSYKDAFEYIKRLIITVDIATKNNVFFNISSLQKLLLVNNAVVINSPVTIKSDINKINAQLAHLYYVLLTKSNFYKEEKLPTQYNIPIPKDLESFLYLTLTEKQSFKTVEMFYNAFYDKVTFSPLVTNKETLEIENAEVSNGKFIRELIMFVIIFIIIILVLVVLTKKVITSIYGLDNRIINSFDKMYEVNDNEQGLKDGYLRSSYLYGSDISTLENYSKIYRHITKSYGMDYESVLTSYNEPSYDYNNSWISTLTTSDVVISEKGLTLLNYYNYYDGTYLVELINEQTQERTILKTNFQLKYPIFIGDKIYFSNENENYHLYSMNVDGSEYKLELEEAVGFIQKNSSEDKLYFISQIEAPYSPNIFEFDIKTRKITNFEDSYENKNFNVFLYLEAFDLLREKTMDFYNELVTEFQYDYFYTNINFVNDNYVYIDNYVDNLILKGDTNKIISSDVSGLMILDNNIYYIKDYDLWVYDTKTEVNKLAFKDGYILYAILNNKIYLEVYDDEIEETSFIDINLNGDGKYEVNNVYSHDYILDYYEKYYLL